MDSLNLLRAPTVGSLVKKIVEINPDLSVNEIVALIRSSMKPRGAPALDFASAEVVDDQRALELARATLRR
jgi:hypothetical protein